MVLGEKRVEPVLDFENTLAGREEACCYLQMLIDPRRIKYGSLAESDEIAQVTKLASQRGETRVHLSLDFEYPVTVKLQGILRSFIGNKIHPCKYNMVSFHYSYGFTQS